MASTPRTRHLIDAAAARHRAPVLGITGTGGSGKSSLTDELVRRFRLDQEDKLRVAVLAIDPTRRKGGGALLGDRIRMNSIDSEPGSRRTPAPRRRRLGRLDGAGAGWPVGGRVLPVLRHPGLGERAARLPRRGHRGLPGRRLRPRHRGDARASARATPPWSRTSTSPST